MNFNIIYMIRTEKMHHLVQLKSFQRMIIVSNKLKLIHLQLNTQRIRHNHKMSFSTFFKVVTTMTKGII